MADGFPNWKMTDRELLAFQMGWEKGKKDAVQRGKWIANNVKDCVRIPYQCSICSGRFDYEWKFCPNCGAKMGVQ